MTVTAAEARIEYAGNGVTTTFAYPYQFFQNDDLAVWLFDNISGAGDQQVLGGDYTVTGALNPTGGNVVMLVAPPGGTTLIIINSPDIVQTLHYVNADDFPADSHEQGLDRLTKICQRLSDRVDRAVRAPDYAPEADVPDADTLINLVAEADSSATAAASSATAAAGFASSAAISSGSAAVSAASAAASAVTAIGVNWRDVWSAGAAYVVNDAVSYAGASYIARANNTNLQPDTHPATWGLMAAQGATGPSGGGAPLASPAFTGNPTAPTPTAGDNDTSLATTAFVKTAVDAAAPVAATAAEYLANSAPTKTVTPGTIWSAAAPVTLADGATVTPNLSLGSDFLWSIGGAGRTLANAINGKAGQKGCIFLVIAGGTLTTWGSQYKFPNGLKPVLSGVTIVSYVVGNDGVTIWCTSAVNLS